MSREQQLYYALWVLLAAVAVLLSPFAYARLRRSRTHRNVPWQRIVLVYVLGATVAAALLYAWLA